MRVCLSVCLSVCISWYIGVCMCVHVSWYVCMLNKNKPDKRVYMSLVLISECGTEVMVTEIEKVCD